MPEEYKFIDGYVISPVRGMKHPSGYITLNWFGFSVNGEVVFENKSEAMCIEYRNDLITILLIKEMEKN